jgi:hypothetical protein
MLVFSDTMSYVIRLGGKLITPEITTDIWESAYSRFLALADELEKNHGGDRSAALKELLDFCGQNPIMRQLTEPLLNMEVGLDHFLSGPNRPRDLTQLTLPDDPNERLAFTYQLLLRINSKLFALSSSAIAGQDIYLSIIDGIHRKFVVTLICEMKIRLERISRVAQRNHHLGLHDLNIIR